MATIAISLDTESTNSKNPDFKDDLKELEATMDNAQCVYILRSTVSIEVSSVAVCFFLRFVTGVPSSSEDSVGGYHTQ